VLARPVAIGALVLLAAGVACKTYKNDPEQLPPGYQPPVYPPAPGRQVYDDGGLITGGGGVQGGGGVVIVGNDSGMPTPGDAASGGRVDMGLVTLDGPASGDAGGACTLLSQSCGPNMGCYPGAAGQGRCERSDPGAGEGVQCFEPANCAPGLTCVSNLCTALCSTAQSLCTSGKRCVPIPPYQDVGYCLP
jgi:hypothetical protein